MKLNWITLNYMEYPDSTIVLQFNSIVLRREEWKEEGEKGEEISYRIIITTWTFTGKLFRHLEKDGTWQITPEYLSVGRGDLFTLEYKASGSHHRQITILKEMTGIWSAFMIQHGS